jgi:Protein of unknown function (DUF1214)
LAPDARMKGILTDAVAVGNAIARTNLCASRDPKTRLYTDRQWWTPFVGGSYQFLDGAERLLDARMMFFYYATGITPAMTESKPGTGSAYAITVRDASGSYLDPNRSYKVTLPGPIPAKDFWSFTVYDNQTRSLLPSDQKLAGLDSTDAGHPHEPGRRRHHLVRPQGTGRPGEELGADHARRGLQHRPAPLRPAAAVVRQELATRRCRIAALMPAFIVTKVRKNVWT